MPASKLTQSLLLPELKFIKVTHRADSTTIMWVEKVSDAEVCPRCATLSQAVYDRRWVTVKDAPIRGGQTLMRILKRRFVCKPCGKPFTEPVQGVSVRARCTERYKLALMRACQDYTNLAQVKRVYRCSSGFLYKTFYRMLELERRKRQHPWPKVLGIDEHSFKRNKKLGCTEFATVVVDYKARRIREVVQGKSGAALRMSLGHIQGRENVRHVVMDMCDPFKNFVREFFPQAQIVADKFHVLRLLNPALNAERKRITGDKRSLPVRRMLLRNGYKLDPIQRFRLHRWLEEHPTLREVYTYKEALHRLYRIKGAHKAATALTRLTDAMARSEVPAVRTLRRTLMKWRVEILNYFETRLTNGRTEGFNNLAKLVKRRAYGYRSFENYRLRLLNACAA